jgi:hypothetical protein
MLKAARPFKLTGFFLLALALALPVQAETIDFKKNKTSLSRDVWEQNFYYEFTSFLRLDRLYRKVTGVKKPAKDVNVFDEVPDNTFFTNRHAKERMSKSELTRGYQINDGPDTDNDLVISRGKFEGVNPGFFVKDSRGDEYLVKFDPADNMEMESGAEAVGSRFYHAIGYNVPQNTIAIFDSQKLVPGEGVSIVDGTGFKRKLTPEKLEEYLLLIPWNEDGQFRASASKILANGKGGFAFHGRRRNDPDDLYNHEDRRELRALQVFSSWLNNNDVRRHNTLSVVTEENGRTILKNYVMDFNASLGAAVHQPKPPNFGHEHFVDYGQTGKAVLGFGFWKKPWQKRWDEAAEKTGPSAIGYFDNRYFEPKKFKTQLPHYAFKDLTRADGFWAAKIIMSFTDEDIRAIVKAGQYSDSKDEDAIANLLIERRDIVGRYWFSQAAPLDSFDLKGGRLVFEDLAVKHGFEEAGQTAYHVEVFAGNKTRKKIAAFESTEPSLTVDPGWFAGREKATLRIRVTRGTSEELSPYVRVELTQDSVTGIRHED